MASLTERRCKPCEGGTPPLKGQELEAYLSQVPTWEAVEGHRIRKSFRFKDFRQALDFVDKVGAIAEQEQHHPTITFGWGRAEVTLFTHAIGGLSENDFILAAKIDRLPEASPPERFK